MTTGFLRQWTLCALVALSASSLAAADPAGPAMDEIADAIHGMRSYIQNAKVKIMNGVGTMGSPENGGYDSFLSPMMQSCCSSNFTHIRSFVGYLEKISAQLEIYYGDTRNRTALLQLDALKTDLGVSVTGVTVFARARDEVEAMRAYRSMFRPFADLQESADALAECCNVPDDLVKLERPEWLKPRPKPKATPQDEQQPTAADQ